MYKIPLTKTEIYEIITKVATNHENKYFGFYTKEDINHECWLIALNKLPEFEVSKRKNQDIKGALENWLNTILSRRLANFFRDKFVVPTQIKKKESHPSVYNQKKSLFFPSPLEESSSIINYDYLSNNNDFLKALVINLDPYQVDILDAILSGETVNLYYKNKLFNAVKLFAKEYHGKTN